MTAVQIYKFGSLDIPHLRMKTPCDTLKTMLIPENLSIVYG